MCCNFTFNFNRYCHIVAGLVGEGLTRLFVACGREDPSMTNTRGMFLADSMGRFLQKTNIIRDYLEVLGLGLGLDIIRDYLES